ncbi:MAG TPA: hypothetical protein VK059_03310 [Nocardioidaceae bacterium]|nr:hypothetical protein [Nocardioidaceae bacterium]
MTTSDVAADASAAVRAYCEHARFRPFALVSPGFEQCSDAGGTYDHLYRARAHPQAPYVAIELTVESAEAPVTAGLTAPDGDGIVVVYHPGRRRVRIIAVVDGERHTLRSRRVRADVQRLAFVACENQITGVIDAGRGWRPAVTVRDRVAALVDLRDPETLSSLAYTWGTRGRGPATLRDITAGVFGMTGVRDPHLVQYADGEPYLRDGKVLVTMTCAGMGFFTQAHWGVFEIDLRRPAQMRQVAHLFTRRDDLLLGDHAGQIVVDGDECIVVVSSWGDFTPERGVHVRHTTTGLDVLDGVHILETERLALPTRHSAWDPSLTRIDDRWRLAYVESPSQAPFRFRPALAAPRAGAAYAHDLELVGTDTAHDQCEGPIIARVDDEWRVLSSDGHAREYPVYDLSMRRVGELDAPYGSNIPHPQIVAGDGIDGEWMLTFDGTPWGERVLKYGTHGDVVLMRR